MNDKYTTGHAGWSPDFKSTPKPPQLGRLIPSNAASCSPSVDTPETKDAYKQRDGEGALAHEIRRAQTMEKLERERNAAKAVMDKLAHCLRCHRHDMLAGEDITWEKRDDESLAEYAALQSPENA